MKIIHTSDWHLGISLNNIPLINDQHHFIDSFIDIVKENKADAVIIAGDIFDNSISKAEAISLYNKAITSLCSDLNIPVFIISGNHDGAARLSSLSGLLKKTGLYISGFYKRPVKPIKINDCHFYLIPYFSIDEARLFFPEEKIQTYEQAMKACLDDIRSEMDKTKKNIAISHAFVSGAALSQSDRSAIIGTAQMVSKDVFSEFSYVALGHLHRPQTIAKNIRYSGSPLKYSISEYPQQKSVTLVDLDLDEIKEIPLKPLKDVRLIKGTYDEIFSSYKEIIDDYISIEVTDAYLSAIDLNNLRAVFPNLISALGKQADPSNSKITLTLGEVKSLSPKLIVQKFMIDTLDISPSAHQEELFMRSLLEAEKGGDFS